MNKRTIIFTIVCTYQDMLRLMRWYDAKDTVYNGNENIGFLLFNFFLNMIIENTFIAEIAYYGVSELIFYETIVIKLYFSYSFFESKIVK